MTIIKDLWAAGLKAELLLDTIQNTLAQTAMLNFSMELNKR
jgi:hypothetical protein